MPCLTTVPLYLKHICFLQEQPCGGGWYFSSPWCMLEFPSPGANLYLVQVSTWSSLIVNECNRSWLTRPKQAHICRKGPHLVTSRFAALVGYRSGSFLYLYHRSFVSSVNRQRCDTCRAPSEQMQLINTIYNSSQQYIKSWFAIEKSSLVVVGGISVRPGVC